MYVLGIDGGGTKTIGVIADRFGKIYGIKTVGATNQNGVEINKIKHELAILFASLKQQNNDAFSQLHTVFAGMSGVDRLEAKEVMRGIISKLVPGHVNIIIDNDGVNALYSGTLGAPGIVQIAGTGSITFGINAQGERKRVGGWGYLFDDEGSGYDIGRAALNAVFKAYDGRGQSTILTNMILDHFQFSQEPELIESIYEVGKSRAMIAPLSKYVSDAADQEDEIAKQIIDRAASKIAHSIGSLCQQLFHQQIAVQAQNPAANQAQNQVVEQSEQAIPVVMVGGIFNRSDLFFPIIEANLARDNINVRSLKPEIKPVAGAVVAALSHANIKIDAGFQKNMANF